MLSFVLVGTAAVSAAVVGLLLPRDQILYPAAALVLGAGVGVVVLGIGFFVANDSEQGAQNVVLIASACGFASVIGGLLFIWRRSQAPDGATGSLAPRPSD